MLALSRRTLLLGEQSASDFADAPRFPEPAVTVSSGAEPIVGLVVFTTHRGERAEAILDGEGRWSCPKLPVLDRVLNILFEPRREGTSPFGHAELHRVAAWIKGSVRLGIQGATP